MANKTKTITLIYPIYVLDAGKELFKIIKITDSVEFTPNKYLDKKEVDELCQAKDWKVTILPPDKG